MSKNVVVTGASGGIGKAIALKFAKQGYNVGLMYLNSKSNAEELQREIEALHVKSFSAKCNVANSEDVKKYFIEAENALGEIDVLVNNAGVALQRLFCDVTEDETDRIFDINVKGAFNCTKAVLPSMVRRKEGKIVNVSSMWGICGASCEVHYSASKAAVIGLTKSLAKEVGPSNINVNCVAPGLIDTKMNSNLDEETKKSFCEDIPLMRIGTPEDVAETVYFLSSNSANYITGQVISVDGGVII